MRVVLDTNVVVSGLLSPRGLCRHILDETEARRLVAVVSEGILAEYERVLRRPSLRLPSQSVSFFLATTMGLAELIDPTSTTVALPHPPDRKFVDCALTGRADYLVTGNTKHYPTKVCHPVRVLTPAEFLSVYLNR